MLGTNLSGAYLREAQLQGARMAAANLRGADLSHADLTGAILSGADLTGANLTETNLSGVTFPTDPYNGEILIMGQGEPGAAAFVSVCALYTIWPKGMTPPASDMETCEKFRH